MKRMGKIAKELRSEERREKREKSRRFADKTWKMFGIFQFANYANDGKRNQPQSNNVDNDHNEKLLFTLLRLIYILISYLLLCPLSPVF